MPCHYVEVWDQIEKETEKFVGPTNYPSSTTKQWFIHWLANQGEEQYCSKSQSTNNAKKETW